MSAKKTENRTTPSSPQVRLTRDVVAQLVREGEQLGKAVEKRLQRLNDVKPEDLRRRAR